MPKRKRSQPRGDVSIFLGEDCKLEGQLSFSGEARIYGEFSGGINGEGHLLVGPTAKVKADIQAGAVEICGDVYGDVNASERIELKSPGHLRGNINAPLVVMDEGVLFEGKCTMNSDEARGKAPNIALLAAGGDN